MQLTKQELFNKMSTHMLTQYIQSNGLYGKNITNEPMYLNSFGLKCPVGALVNDQTFFNVMEGKNVRELPQYILEDMGVNTGDFYLLEEMQIVHDEYDPSKWKHKLAEVANRYMLSEKVLEKF